MPASWDVRCIQGLKSLSYLVLAAGFTGIHHLEAWPASCKRFMWTCPSDAHSSKLSVPPFPKNMNLTVRVRVPCACRFACVGALVRVVVCVHERKGGGAVLREVFHPCAAGPSACRLYRFR